MTIDFVAIATPLVERGFRVTPVHPETKMGVMKNWQITTPAEPLKYSKGKYANHNVGVVGKRGVGRHCFLDVDAPGVVERIENETKHEMPKGDRVKSSPTSKPYKTHFYFTQTQYSFEKFGGWEAVNSNIKDMTTIDDEGKHPTLYDLKGVGGGSLVVGAGSVKQSGEVYTCVDDGPVPEIPKWLTARQMPDGTYKEIDGILDHLPIEYRGQTATVIDVQYKESLLQKSRVGGTNAFGETVGEEEIDDPYLKIVIRFKDGTLAMTTGYPITLVPQEMELASNRQSLKEYLESKLPTAVGKKLYAVAYSRLYKPTARIEEVSGREEILARLSDVPFLEPLIITKAKYLPDVNAVVIKLSLPNGAEAIGYTPSNYIRFDDPKEGFLTGIAGTLLASIPKDLTPKEIDAIRGTKVFRGMSKDALAYSVGFCEKENDWGPGGTQQVYFDGKLMVYLDHSEKVEDWQSLD